jgi:hypothetical protein
MNTNNSSVVLISIIGLLIIGYLLVKKIIASTAKLDKEIDTELLKLSINMNKISTEIDTTRENTIKLITKIKENASKISDSEIQKDINNDIKKLEKTFNKLSKNTVFELEKVDNKSVDKEPITKVDDTISEISNLE